MDFCGHTRDLRGGKTDGTDVESRTHRFRTVRNILLLQCLMYRATLISFYSIQHCRRHSWVFWYSFVFSPSWLGHMQRPGNHAASVNREQPHNRMKLKNRSLANRTERYAILQPVLRRPVAHQCRNTQACWDREPFEVRSLASRVFRDVASRDIEPR